MVACQTAHFDQSANGDEVDEQVHRTALVKIEAAVRPEISYALMHNRVSPVRAAQVTNTSTTTLSALEVSVLVEAMGEPIGDPWVATFDVAPLASQGWTNLRLDLDAVRMRAVTERQQGRILFQVAAPDGSVLARAAYPIEVVPYNLWTMAGEPDLVGALLAAHVMPNHPAITSVLAEARRLLEQRTGSSATQGYQAGPARADDIAHAIYDAVAARGIAYSNPPASWGDRGQKIRNPEEVLDGRVGTCLDTAVTLAAAFEQAGLEAVLWLVEGHAFAGYWTDPRGNGKVPRPQVESDTHRLAMLVEAGMLRMVETTTLTKSIGYLDAVAATASYLHSEFRDVEMVVDVAQCRVNGIVPLPAIVTANDVTTVVEYVAAAPSLQVSGTAARERPDPTPDPSPARVQRWKSQLLDLSLRNPLINFVPGRHGIAVQVPSAALGTLEDVLHAGWSLALLPNDDVDAFHRELGARGAQDIDAETISRIMVESRALFTATTNDRYLADLRKVASKARTNERSTGANTLFLSIGMLEWTSDGKQMSSPIFLLPIRMTGGTRKAPFSIKIDESAVTTPNYSLVEKLKRDHGITVPELETPKLDEHGIDVAGSLAALKAALVAEGLAFIVNDTAYLTLLEFTKFRLWKDLDDHWQRFLGNPVVQHLAMTPEAEFDDPAATVATQDLSGRVPIPADSSQLAAVERAVAGQSFVLEGPPGTGKSQTITNLIAACLAEGRKVLFIAEKQVALEVVKRRLDDVGLEAFCLDMHDKASKPDKLRAQLLQSMDFKPGYDSSQFDAAVADRDAIAQLLEQYPDKLHTPNAIGVSVWKARQELLLEGEGPTVEIPAGFIEKGPEAVARTRSALEDLPVAADSAGLHQDHPWSFARISSIDSLDTMSLAEGIAQLSIALPRLPSAGTVTGDALEAAATSDELRRLAAVAAGPAVDLSTLDRIDTVWQTSVQVQRDGLAAARQALPRPLQLVAPAILQADLDGMLARAQEAATSGPMSRSRKLKVAASELTPYLLPGQTINPAALVPLIHELLQLRTYSRNVEAAFAALPGMQLPAGWNAYDDQAVTWIDHLAGVQRAAADLVQGSGTFGTLLRQAAADPVRPTPDQTQALSEASQAWARIANTLGLSTDSSTAIDDQGLRVFWNARVGAWQKDASSGFLSLRRWIDLESVLGRLRAEGMADLVDAVVSQRIDATEAMAVFRRSLARTSLAEGLALTGLDRFDGHRHDERVDRFLAADDRTRGLMTDAIPHDLLLRRADEVSRRRTELSELRRELTKQRGRRLGIRELFDQFPGIITTLTPCVMMSPDSAARFLQPGVNEFDVVVFDEASQIPVPEAIGAMGRGKSVVIVGDSKQMPPSQSRGGSTLADDDELGVDDGVAELDSILEECVEARLPQLWLSWHYRSKDEQLIAFSNHQYYGSKLSSFPTPGLPARTTGLRFVKVPGRFNRSTTSSDRRALTPDTRPRTNPQEARAIVAEIQARMNDPRLSQYSVGVVTFNKEQKELIEYLLDRLDDDAVIAARDDATAKEPVFVKNLEDVQGDERDVILFSVAFSAQEDGKFPLTMGAMTSAGGEKRLNVAITRARREVVVFCSFEPSELPAERAAYEGVKHLKAYLQLARNGELPAGAHAESERALDRHRDQIADALRQRGLAVRTNVGLSDFKVDLALAPSTSPETEVVAVLLDGPGWRSRRTIQDRDGLPVSVLEKQMGWPGVARVWLPAWLQEPEAITDALAQQVEVFSSVALEGAREALELAEADQQVQAITQDAAESPIVDETTPEPTIDWSAVAVDAGDEAPWLVDEEPLDPPAADLYAPQAPATPQPMVAVSAPAPEAETRVTTVDALETYQPWVSPALEWTDDPEQLAAWLVDVVNAEGPMQASTAYRRITVACGFGRMGGQIKSSLNKAAAQAVRKGLIAQISDGIPGQIHKTLYAVGTPAVRPRALGDRNLAEVPRSEVHELAVALGLGTLDDETIKRAVLTAYGRKQLTAAADAYLTECFDYEWQAS